MEKFKNLFNRIKAFSLVEVMVSIIVLSIVAAAFTPIATKKIRSEKMSMNSKINILSGPDCAGSDYSKHENLTCVLCDADKKECLRCEGTCPSGQAKKLKDCSCSECTIANCKTCSSSTVCAKCDSGYYIKNNGCTICSAGYYCENGTSQTACPAGTYRSATGGESLDDCSLCPKGWYCPNTAMREGIKCQIGLRQPSEGQTTCVSCPAGKYCKQEATWNGWDCNAGTYNPSTNATSESACLPCPKNTYAASSGSSICTNCAANFITASTGTNSASGCYCDQENGWGIKLSGTCTQVPTGWVWTGINGVVMMQKNVGDAGFSYNELIPAETYKSISAETTSDPSTYSCNGGYGQGQVLNNIRCVWWDVPYTGTSTTLYNYTPLSRVLSTWVTCNAACSNLSTHSFAKNHNITNTRLLTQDEWVTHVGSKTIARYNPCYDDGTLIYTSGYIMNDSFFNTAKCYDDKKCKVLGYETTLNATPFGTWTSTRGLDTENGNPTYRVGWWSSRPSADKAQYAPYSCRCAGNW